MSVKQLNTDMFRKMTEASAKILKQNAKMINSLNVFPVPDGDTGTNISMTVVNGNKYVTQDNTKSMNRLTNDFAKGLLMGARGNSGVITSQIFRGFADATKNKQSLTAKDVIRALKQSTLVSYQAVMKPTEGTILTVIRNATQGGIDEYHKTHDLKKILVAVYQSGEKALQTTPQLLAVLNKVGVVDSGGQGLVLIFKAWASVINGKKISAHAKPTPEEMSEMVRVAHHKSAQSLLNPNSIKYGYCTQITVRFGLGKEYNRRFNYHLFYNYLAKLGNSLLVANDKHVVKVHVHTEHPGKVLAWGQKFGDLIHIKIDNMRYQQEGIINRDKKGRAKQNEHKLNNIYKKNQLPKVKTAIVSISAGKGLHKLFKSLGVFAQVNGGQTMNPSAEDILKVINVCGNRGVIILPNNGNVYMASKVASQKAKQNCKVLPTKSVQQGMATMLGYMPNADLKNNYNDMKDNMDENKSGAVTYATRDTKIGSIKIGKGNFIGLNGKQIVSADSHRNTQGLYNVTLGTIENMLDDDSEIVTLIYSSHKDKKALNKVCKELKDGSPDLEIETHCGNQPVYNILISVE